MRGHKYSGGNGYFLGDAGMRRIGIVTTSRADYGIYRSILSALRSARAAFELYVTGTHLHEGFGLSVREIENDGYPVAARLKVRLGNSPGDIARTMGEVTCGFAGILSRRKPDILVVLGDRYEMHAAALAAVPFGIPIAHIHGGELTFGAIDDQFRHSLTKLSALHFASTGEYARRICQMGEDPKRVINSGAPGLAFIRQKTVVPKAELARQFGIDFSKDVVVVTFHPVTQEYRHTPAYIKNLLSALGSLKDVFLVFTGANADTGHHVIGRAVREFLRCHPQSVLVKSFGSLNYLSLLAHARVMVGNSSSGIIEAASFRLPVVNIGTRQAGRVRAGNVIDVGYAAEDIRQGIRRALSADFRSSLKGLKNPYFKSGAAAIIARTLSRVDLKTVNCKKFKDIVWHK
jgi:UDP-hydrolysing UDP-N-acetyl-D-glucosamine 2-epimerase